MPEDKPSAIEIATEMLNHHLPDFAYSLDQALGKLVSDIVILRDKLLEQSKVKRDRAKAMEDSPAEILTKVKLEGEQRGYYDAYCMADAIITESAERVRAALKAGVAQYFDVDGAKLHDQLFHRRTLQFETEADDANS